MSHRAFIELWLSWMLGFVLWKLPVAFPWVYQVRRRCNSSISTFRISLPLPPEISTTVFLLDILHSLGREFVHHTSIMPKLLEYIIHFPTLCMYVLYILYRSSRFEQKIFGNRFFFFFFFFLRTAPLGKHFFRWRTDSSNRYLFEIFYCKKTTQSTY